MSGMETVGEQLPGLIGHMAIVGFAVAAFVTLVTIGLCALFHVFVKIIGKEG